MPRVIRPRRRRDDQHGFVAVWMSVVVLLLLFTAALAVDLVHGYAERQHLQNAVDAAALAAAVEIHTDTSGSNASGRMNQVLDAHYNGSSALAGVTLDATQTGVDSALPGGQLDNQFDIYAQKKVDTFFAKVIPGISGLTVTARAKAQYDPPVQMGSAANYVGVVPSCPNGGALTTCENVVPFSELETPPSVDGGLFPSIEGASVGKQQGNAITTSSCPFTSTDGCNGATNIDQNATGCAAGSSACEDFAIRNDSTGNLDIHIYDPAFVTAGTANCAVPLTVPGWPAFVTSNYGTNEYCPGDYVAPSPGTPPTTTYTLLDPNANPPYSAAVPGCTKSFTGYNSPDLARTAENGGAQPSFFHQWYTLCTFGSNPTTDGLEYILRVSTSSGVGINNFTVLAAHNGLQSPGLQVFSRKLLPIAVRGKDASPHTFFLARVLPSSEDRTLNLNFFDLGDSTFGPNQGYLKVGLYGVTHGTLSCSYTPPPSNTTSGANRDPMVVPFADSLFTPSPATSATCGTAVPASGVHFDANSASATWDGRWISMKITIPKQTDPTNGYKCTTTGPTAYQNCWLTLTETPDTTVVPCPAAPNPCVSDVTTWNANLGNAPVRLVG